MLRATGYSVEAFPSARSFLDDFDPRRGGCLLLDVRMPQMTGLELQQQLNVRGWRIPVIFITGHGTVPLAIAAMKAGAFDFIEKPLREDALLESIERALHWNDRAYEERLERATLQVRATLLTAREREVFELVAAGDGRPGARPLVRPEDRGRHRADQRLAPGPAGGRARRLGCQHPAGPARRRRPGQGPHPHGQGHRRARGAAHRPGPAGVVPSAEMWDKTMRVADAVAAMRPEGVRMTLAHLDKVQDLSKEESLAFARQVSRWFGRGPAFTESAEAILARKDTPPEA